MNSVTIHLNHDNNQSIAISRLNARHGTALQYTALHCTALHRTAPISSHMDAILKIGIFIADTDW